MSRSRTGPAPGYSKVIRLGGAAGVLAVALWTSPPVLAINPPTVDAGVVPPSGTPGPVQATQQNSECGTTEIIAGTDLTEPPAAQRQIDLAAAWQFSRGDGQTVAVIDTGVRPGPRLPAVEPGGDYIGTTDGLTDCDGHGTLIAGLIAGQPGDDGFAGVAPAARLLSLRATSAKITPATSSGDPESAQAAFTVAALSRAIVHAADLGARVITVSAVHCVPADRPVDQSELGAAIRYAAVDKDAVVIAAAGDSGATGSFGGGTGCQSNPLTDLSRPGDPRSWGTVGSVSIPSSWQPYVLSVASLAPNGQPSKFTTAGPWVGVAAPGENIVSVSNRDDGGLANALLGARQKLVPLSGTGYASGYVAGVAALVRSRYPELSAAQVIHRLTATARNTARAPSNILGAGALDPVAALTWQLPIGSVPAAEPVKRAVPPPQPEPKNYTPQLVASGGAAALGLAVGATAIAARRRKETAL
ncbi:MULTISPECIES: type VII secretion-associated serine protease mycosin [unclassified Mycobacterium]|uniref:type VII secretion-associated serine protease mycosin n=1 Tax=unclassified Mycobacterium TaxID=2642494 RepID=UPI0009E5AFBD|nr:MULTISPECIES: type VII secretion-associated serine protease mycosin [unclassified Mycobacterium]